jgi:regulatory protein YycH of two-component signal transduction system YycFG
MHVHAAGKLVMVIKPDVVTSTLVLTLANAGDAAVQYSTDQLPIPRSSGFLSNNSLRVTDTKGQEADYQGSFVSYGTVSESNGRKTIPPGQSIRITLDLAKNYKLTPGEIYGIDMRYGAGYWLQTPNSSATAVEEVYRQIDVPTLQFAYQPK